jgi:plasmid segregation protein ParM
MKIMKILGIDIGFGFTKATNGNDTVIFKSIFGDATDLQFWMDFGGQSITDFFHVTIDGKSYFIGDLAEQQSNVTNFTLDQERLISEFVKILALTVAGVFLKKDAEINVPINIVSGLPIGYFKANYERFNDILTGHHSVTYHQYNGNKVVKEIYINKIRMLPQPLGTILNLLMDEDGKIINKDLVHQKIGVVDIGFRTTDFTIMDRLRYIDRGSRTMDTGISKAFSIIANKLREKCGVSVPLYRLYKAAESGTIKMKGHGLNFAKIRDQVYSQLASNIANDIDRLWAEDWDIDTVVLTGGGSVELASYLQPMIAGNVRPLTHDVDIRLNNVLGYLKYAKHIWGNHQEESQEETRPKAEAVSGTNEPVTPQREPTPEVAPLEDAVEYAPMLDDDALEEIEDLVEENLSEYR